MFEVGYVMVFELVVGWFRSDMKYFLPDEIFFHFYVDGSEIMCITGVKPPGA